MSITDIDLLVRLLSMNQKYWFWWLIGLMVMVLISCAEPASSPIRVLPTTTPTQFILTPIATSTVESQFAGLIPEDDLGLRGITIKFWYPWYGEAAGKIDELINDFNQTNPQKIIINAQPMGSVEYLESSMLDSLTSKNEPDILAASIPFLSALHQEQQNLVDINSYINNKKWGLNRETVLSFPLTFWNQDLDGDFRFGFPAQRDAHLLFYDQSWAKQLGYQSPPQTPDDFLNQSCAAARVNAYDNDLDNNGTGGWLYNTNSITVLSWLRGFNGGILPQQKEDQYHFDIQSNEEAFTYLYKLNNLDCAWTGKESDPYQYFANKQAIFFSGTLQDILLQEKKLPADEWSVIPYPSLNQNPVVLVDGYSYGIVKSTPEKQLAAWLFIQWLTKPENQAKMISVTGTFPLTNTAIEYLTDFRKQHPAWNSALQYIPLARSAPNQESWLITGKVLQDAAWQLTQYTVKQGDIPTILGQTDQLIQSLQPQ